MQMTPQATRSSSVDAADRNLGEILWRDTESGIEGRTVIRTPKCTIGSHPESTICLPEPAALCHATLTFGKRFTLLKAPYPTQIAGRFVREWLIDEPTELNIGNWRIVVVPARCSKSLASVMRPEDFLDRTPVSAPPKSVSHPVVHRAAENPSNVVAATQQAIERMGRIEEQYESRIQAIEASLDHLHHTLESVQSNVAQNANEWVTRYQAEIQNLSQQLTTQLQQSLQSQLEHRDSTWNQSLTDNLASLENQMTTLGHQMESLATGVQERLASQQPSSQQDPERGNPLLLASLQQLEGQLEEISNRVDRLSSTADDNAQRLDAIAAITQENYDYVLGQIQNFQPPVPNSWASPQSSHNMEPAYDRQEEVVPSPVPSPVESGWEDHQPVNFFSDDVSFSIESNPATPGPIYDEENQASVSDNQIVPEYQDMGDGYTVDGEEAVHDTDVSFSYPSYQDLSSNELPALPEEPSFNPGSSRYESLEEQQELESQMNVDDLSERLRRLIAEASQPESSVAEEDSPLFPNSVLSQYEPSENEQIDEPNTDEEFPRSEWRPTNHFDDNLADESVVPKDGFSQTRLPWNSPESNEADYLSERDAPPSLDADTILAKYGSSGIEEASVGDVTDSLPPPSTQLDLPEQELDETVDDESIEAYMQKLLLRVKTGADAAIEMPSLSGKQAQRSRMEILTGAVREPVLAEEDQAVTTTRRLLSPGEFTPRNTAPEKKNELDALRELANMNARRAISHSDKKRNNSAILFKVSIVSLAIACAAIIFSMNGMQKNPPFFGMIAALVVAGLWGYDCFQYLRRMARSQDKGRANEPTPATPDAKILSQD
ncbi:hypothetical protein [Pirellula sp. SH-Sr6A]|uniref:hypothetical protein n=1 Tax=Pirellula sp. SH-Sr6A TaxID=1632865 RepID=UPI0011BAAFAC|nr:hypothetical protein [Pirellula sp. SH-Sr6A]